MIVPLDATNWRAAVAFGGDAVLELMARAYLATGESPVVEYDGTDIVAVFAP